MTNANKVLGWRGKKKREGTKYKEIDSVAEAKKKKKGGIERKIKR